VKARIDRLRAELDRLGAESFLVSDPVNLRYLTGFESSNAYLLVGRERILLATDYRYLEAARSLAGVEVAQGERDLAAWLGPRLGELAEAPVAFEADHLTVAAREGLAAAGAELVATRRVVLGLRAVKEPEELDAVRAAAAVLTRGFEALVDHKLVGYTERELAWFLERSLREAGSEAVAFDPIVAAGANGALPHHHPGERRIEPGELVLVDAGARVDGYCSDCTRTFATGALPAELDEAYADCRRAQEAALAAVGAGANGREVHELARRTIEEGGREHLQHGVGHGVGLEVHESPVLREGVDAALVPGNVVTVEPGIYLAGRGGVRIEDLVVVGKKGIEVLTTFTKDLLTLD
jgi:Xaa-Pro aminopeptidase